MLVPSSPSPEAVPQINLHNKLNRHNIPCLLISVVSKEIGLWGHSSRQTWISSGLTLILYSKLWPQCHSICSHAKCMESVIVQFLPTHRASVSSPQTPKAKTPKTEDMLSLETGNQEGRGTWPMLSQTRQEGSLGSLPISSVTVAFSVQGEE